MYTVMQIIERMSLPNNTLLLITFTMANLFGLLQYIWAISLTIKEKKGPFPIWMHTFFLAHDSTGGVVFLLLFLKYKFWIFGIYSVGLFTWTIMEIFCIYMDIKYNRQEIYGNENTGEISVSYATVQVILQIAIMYCIINFLRYAQCKILLCFSGFL